MRRLTTSRPRRYAVRLSALCSVLLLASTATQPAQAQDPRRGYGVGVAGQGTDMTTQAMSGLRLFTPHRNNCNATTEVFVKIYTNSNTVDFGFCMDKDEHSAGITTWQDARQTCLDEGKRLPEPGEFLHALDTVSASLSNTGEDYEWSTNFASTEYAGGVHATVAVNIRSSTSGSWGYVASPTSGVTTIPFRCVR